MPLSMFILLADRHERMLFKVHGHYLLRIRHVSIKYDDKETLGQGELTQTEAAIWQVTSSHEPILSSSSSNPIQRMRFTPTDRPKKPLVEDTTKKIHVKFDNDDNEPKVENKKRSSSDQTIDHQPKKQKTINGNTTSKEGRKAVQITVPGASLPKPNNKNNKRPVSKGIPGE